MSEHDIHTAMKANLNRLMSIDGVTGVGLGELKDKSPCIMIMVVEQTDALIQKLPTEIEGYPVRLLESGEIKPM